MKKVALAASAALAVSSVFVIVQPASGALRTTCTGTAGAVTVPGDLIVPRGEACVLQGTVITGDVRVGAGADLLLEGATVSGSVQVTRDGYVDIIAGSSVAGELRSRNAFGTIVEDSSLGGNVVQTSPRGAVPFLYLFSTGVAGAVESRAGEVLIESSEVQGAVSARNGDYVDVIDSVLGNGLTVRNNVLGAVVCESEVYGDSLFGGNRNTLQIGGSGAVGPCDGASFWGGDVTFTDNTAAVTGFDISNNIVSGDLVGSGNDPLPTGAGNRVRGEITLPFAEAAAEAGEVSLQSQSARSVEIQTEAEVVVDDRAAELQLKVAERRGAALAESAATPEGQALSPAPSS